MLERGLGGSLSVKFLGILILFISGIAQAGPYVEDFTAYEVGYHSPTPLTIEGLRSTIASLPNPTIETLLPALKKQDPDIFNNYILLYGSRSLQESSPENPRALLVSKQAELIISFNGHNNQKGFNDLEVMFFDKIENKFNFQEFSFREGKVKASSLNPAKCLACHQSPNRVGVDPRPNWEAYNVWPGVYGSVAHHSDVTDSANGPRYNAFLAGQKQNEEKWAKEFFEKILPVHDRYSLLVPFSKSTYNNKDYYYFSGHLVNFSKAPNRTPTLLTQSLAVLNGRRLARMMQTDYGSIHESYKYAILAATKCFELALPEHVKQWHKNKLAEKNIPWHPSVDQKHVAKLEDAIDFIFNAYGVDTADWTTDFNTNGQFAHSQKYGIPAGTGVNNNAYTKGFQEVWNLPEFYEDDDCESLKAKSLAVLNEKFKPEPINILPEFSEIATAKSQSLLNRCIECHVTLSIGPFIPFDDTVALKEALNKNDGALRKKIQYRLGPFPAFRDAMPPQGYVYPGQKAEVLEYINSLR